MAPLAALARLNYDKEAAEDAWQRMRFGRYRRDETAAGLAVRLQQPE